MHLTRHAFRRSSTIRRSVSLLDSMNDSRRIYRALIVDDDEAICDAVARAMAAESFWCETAADGVEALAKYQASRHDLVVIDLRMPRMHGHALTLELLKDEQRPHIVVLTGVAEPVLVKDLLSRGVDDVVGKPIDARVFAIKMAAIFERDLWRLEAMGVDDPQALAGHSLVARIESAFEASEFRLPPRADRLLVAAHEELAEPPQAMLNFLERTFADPGAAGDRRRGERVSLLATVAALPVDGEFNPAGEAFRAAARDISSGGISLLHTRAVSSECMALRWQTLNSKTTFITAAIQLTRCRPMGPFYELAGQFVPPL